MSGLKKSMKNKNDSKRINKALVRIQTLWEFGFWLFFIINGLKDQGRKIMSWTLIDLDKDIDLLGVVFMSYIEDLCNEKDDKDHIKEVELLHEKVVTFLIEEKSK